MAGLEATLGDDELPPRLLACPRCGSTYSSQTHRCGIDGEPLVRPLQDFLVGRTIDRYQIIERIGVGAMGCVYRARHVELENLVAIKVLLGELGADQRFVARFRREAQILHQTAHPNVVRVLDFGKSSEGLPYMVMELLEGRTLEALIGSDAPFSPGEVRRLCRGILAGLAAIHEAGFVHRDLKPANVMVGASIKLLDFGIAGMVDATKGTKLTATGKILGTPTYMAPEQAEESEVQPTADLYSIGAIMFELLTGRPPFDGQRLGEVLVKHATLAPPPLPPSDGLDDVVARLLSKRPADRPQSAAEVIALLEPEVIGPKRRARSASWLASAAAGVGLAVIGGVVGRASSPAPESPPPRVVAAIPAPPPPTPIAVEIAEPEIVEPTESTIAPAPHPQKRIDDGDRLEERLTAQLGHLGLDPADLASIPELEALRIKTKSGSRGERRAALEALVERVSQIDRLESTTLKAKLDRTLRALQGASDRLSADRLAALEERALAAGESVGRGVSAESSLRLAREIAEIEREIGR
jgi:hypothetical protein